MNTSALTRFLGRPITWVLLSLCTLLGHSTRAEPFDATKESAPIEKGSRRPTLNELKTAGAVRSRYRQDQAVEDVSTTPQPKLAEFRASVRPVLTNTCVQCHGADSQEGGLRIDTLDPDLLHGDDVDWWIEVMSVLSNGEMPPPEDAELSDEDRSAVLQWLSSEIQVASLVRRAEQGHSSFRRMTRYETNYALQDLLGLEYDFTAALPPEPESDDGFQNSSELLQMSAPQFGYYRDLSRNALTKVTVKGKQPEPIYWGISMERAGAKALAEEQKKALEKSKRLGRAEPAPSRRRRVGGTHYKDLVTGLAAKANWGYRGARYAWKPTSTRPEVPPVSDHVAILPAGQRLIVELGKRVPESGLLRVRVRASRANADDDYTPSLQLEFGWQASNNSAASVRVSDTDLAIDATPDEPKFYQWDVPLSEIYPRNPMRKTAAMGQTPSPSEYVKLVNSSVSRSDIQIDYVEISAPVYEQWPPNSHRRIFVKDGASDDEVANARAILTNFMSRAWRRPATDAEVDQKLELFARVRPACDDFQEAMIEVLATVLASPKFLYLVQSLPGDPHNGNLSPPELASRLSIFLWSSIPDEDLVAEAESGRLDNPEVLIEQTKRMLADPRARRFSNQFVRGWLGLQLLDFLDVDRKSFPEFDRSLKDAMLEEPIAMFHETLENNHSVIDFIHADYTMANERLAAHYGLTGIEGNHFRPVALEPQHRRGGLLAQAGLLAMNSDGKDSHPLKRGIWMLESLLNDPPPPPPPAVPEIDLADPEIAKLTLKQRIENHRNHAACMSCHAKIDPWGIAFEQFDAIGSFRTEIEGKPVDATSRLFNGQKLEGMDGLKRYLLEHRQDQFVRAMVYKMTTYALGRPLTFGDRSTVEQITADLRQRGDGLETLVTLIVTSDLFRSK